MDWHTEVASAKGCTLEGRPVLAAALQQAKKGKMFVLVAKMDRLSRDTHFVSGLMAHRVPFIVTELGELADPFVLGLYALLAEKERNMTSERTKAGMAAKKAQGVIMGNRVNLRTVAQKGAATNAAAAVVYAANVLPVIRQIEAAGITTLVGIAGALNARGARTAKGGAWYATTVRNVMMRQHSQRTPRVDCSAVPLDSLARLLALPRWLQKVRMRRLWHRLEPFSVVVRARAQDFTHVIVSFV